MTIERRFDSIERVVRDQRGKLSDVESTVMARLATHTHAGGDITSGMLDLARIPTGTAAGTVALGDHTHDRLVGRNQRTTNSAAITTIQRVLSVSAPVVAGRTYRVVCDGQVWSNSGAATSQHELRYTTNNTEPATTSPILGRTITRHDATDGVPDGCHVEGLFVCIASGTLRVAMCSQRVRGAVTIAWNAASDYPMLLLVEDVGDTIAASGTVY